MYYRRALKLQAFLDMATEKGKAKLVLFYVIFSKMYRYHGRHLIYCFLQTVGP
jgi:hypothetical protein